MSGITSSVNSATVTSQVNVPTSVNSSRHQRITQHMKENTSAVLYVTILDKDGKSQMNQAFPIKEDTFLHSFLKDMNTDSYTVEAYLSVISSKNTVLKSPLINPGTMRTVLDSSQ